MSRARKAKGIAVKSAPALSPSVRHASMLLNIDRRLARACDLMDCVEHCKDAELNLGALAIATRDLLDTIRDDLVPIRRNIAKEVRP